MAIVCGKANQHDQRFALKTVDKITIKGRVRRPSRIGADKGYDCDQFRQALRKRHIIPCLLRRQNNHKNIIPSELKEQRYNRQRWKVERSFSWINNNRRIDRFMEKKTATYEGFCYLMFIKYYLKKLIK